MFSLYFMSAYRGELMLVRHFVAEIHDPTNMFADHSLFLLGTFVNEKLNKGEYFAFIVTL